jgi:hypothetical protein
LAHQHGVLQVFLTARAPSQPDLVLHFLKARIGPGNAKIRHNWVCSEVGGTPRKFCSPSGTALTTAEMLSYSFLCIYTEEELQNALYCAADSASPGELKPAVRALSLQLQKNHIRTENLWQPACLQQPRKKLLEAFMQRWTPLLITLVLMLGIASFAQQPAAAPDQQPSTQQPDQPAQPPAAQPQSGQQSPDRTAPTTDSSTPEQQPSGQTFSGTIVKSGDKYVLQDDKGTTYDIDHQDVVKKFEGKKVRVVGTLDSTGKMIHVQ